MIDDIILEKYDTTDTPQCVFGRAQTIKYWLRQQKTLIFQYTKSTHGYQNEDNRANLTKLKTDDLVLLLKIIFPRRTT